MDLNSLLWIGGTLFSLGIFAVKVGLGLRYGQAGVKGVLITLTAYVFLFVVMALLSKILVDRLEPVLRKGPYLHLLMALGLMIWGIFSLRSRREHNLFSSDGKRIPVLSAMPLILPCPVCLTAMTFSTWTALTVSTQPPVYVGLGVGLAFTVMTLTVMGLASRKKVEHPETALGLTMLTLGLYFIASFFLPAKIEEAKGVYASLAEHHHRLDGYQALRVGIILLALMFVGFFSEKYRESKK